MSSSKIKITQKEIDDIYDVEIPKEETKKSESVLDEQEQELEDVYLENIGANEK